MGYQYARFVAFPLLYGVLLFAGSCSSNAEPGQTGNAALKSGFVNEKLQVELGDMQQGTFQMEILTNGKALALHDAEIRFPVNEKITSIYVKNSDLVQKGQVLALLDDTELKSKLERSKVGLEKAITELDDRLIDYGYRLKDSVVVPVEIMRMAKNKSGYNAAQYDFADAKAMVGKTVIVAPFSGKIANLEARVFNTAEGFRKLCTLIDDSKMQVEFNVLEAEYHLLAKGSYVEVSPFGSDVSLKGIVTQVNPVIDQNGMIKIIALVDNSRGLLLDGMGVRVIGKKTVPEKLFIQKQAVVIRDNRQVVFTYENGRAKWNYVETGLQNSKYICISSGLRPGHKVIISNNINLAHDSEVNPVNKQ